jgi:hypothetical protein
VAKLIVGYLTTNHLFKPFQSGFRDFHSTDTAVTRAVNYILLTLDTNPSSMLVLLDLSAAFDTINHSILLHCLDHYVGFGGSAVRWLDSYLTICVNEGSESKHCVPQGSVLGPLLFAIYMLPLGDVIRAYGISFYCYADDTQLFLPVESEDSCQIQNIDCCLAAVNSWMSKNFMQLNTWKTEQIIIVPKQDQRKMEAVSCCVWMARSSRRVPVSKILASCLTLCSVLINMLEV